MPRSRHDDRDRRWSIGGGAPTEMAAPWHQQHDRAVDDRRSWSDTGVDPRAGPCPPIRMARIRDHNGTGASPALTPARTPGTRARRPGKTARSPGRRRSPRYRSASTPRSSSRGSRPPRTLPRPALRSPGPSPKTASISRQITRILASRLCSSSALRTSGSAGSGNSDRPIGMRIDPGWWLE